MAASVWEQLLAETRGGKSRQRSNPTDSPEGSMDQPAVIVDPNLRGPNGEVGGTQRERGSYYDVPYEPSVRDLADASSSDAEIMQQLGTMDWQDRQAALNKLFDVVSGGPRGNTPTDIGDQVGQMGIDARDRVKGEAEGAANFGFSQGEKNIGDVQVAAGHGLDRLAGASGEASQLASSSLNDVEGSRNRANSQLDEMLAGLNSTRGTIAGSVQDIWDRGAKAISDYGDNINAEASSWRTGHERQNAAAKEQRSAQMAAAGYRPEEIDAEMRRMDADSMQVASQQIGQFQAQRQETIAKLQQAYTEIGADVTKNATNALTNLDQIEAGTREANVNANTQLTGLASNVRGWLGDTKVGVAKASNEVEQWGADATSAQRQWQTAVKQWQVSVDAAAESGAVQAMSEAKFGAAQMEDQIWMAQQSGLTSWAAQLQGLSRPFVPKSGVMSDVFGLVYGLLNNQMSTDVSTLNGVLNSWMTAQGGLQNMTGTLQSMKAAEIQQQQIGAMKDAAWIGAGGSVAGGALSGYLGGRK